MDLNPAGRHFLLKKLSYIMPVMILLPGVPQGDLRRQS